jgi:FkbM family methyltransferase
MLSAWQRIHLLGGKAWRWAAAPFVATRPAYPAVTERHGPVLSGWRLCSDRLGPESVVYSAGLGTDISFDISLIQKWGLTVHGFDPTPRSAAWLRAQALPPKFKFHEIGLGAQDRVARFASPLTPRDASYSMIRQSTRSPAVECPVRRINSLMGMLGHSRIDILKMDIEGAEYEVIEDIASTRPDIGQILVEFHARFLPDGFRMTNRAISLLIGLGYKPFWTSWKGVEYGFLRE